MLKKSTNKKVSFTETVTTVTEPEINETLSGAENPGFILSQAEETLDYTQNSSVNRLRSRFLHEWAITLKSFIGLDSTFLQQ